MVVWVGMLEWVEEMGEEERGCGKDNTTSGDLEVIYTWRIVGSNQPSPSSAGHVAHLGAPSHDNEASDTPLVTTPAVYPALG